MSESLYNIYSFIFRYYNIMLLHVIFMFNFSVRISKIFRSLVVLTSITDLNKTKPKKLLNIFNIHENYMEWHNASHIIIIALHFQSSVLLIV